MADSGKTVLVTGAAKRIGRTIALALADSGWSVAVHCNTSAREAAETAAAIRAKGVRASVVAADLTREEEAANLIARAADAMGPITALVNNASVFENDTIETASRASWDRHMEVNLRAPFVLAQAFARALPVDGDGAIVNIVDQRLFKPTPNFMSYSVSRAGLGWLTFTLAQALAPRIRVNAVAPGPTLANARQSAAHFRSQSRATILGRGSTPADVAAATLYLLGAPAVTGQILAVDGGQHLVWRTADAIAETE